MIIKSSKLSNKKTPLLTNISHHSLHMLEKEKRYCVLFEHKKIIKLKVVKIMDFELTLKILTPEYTSDESYKNDNLSRIDEINIKLYETQVIHERLKISLMGLRKNRAWIDVVKTGSVSTN